MMFNFLSNLVDSNSRLATAKIEAAEAVLEDSNASDQIKSEIFEYIALKHDTSRHAETIPHGLNNKEAATFIKDEINRRGYEAKLEYHPGEYFVDVCIGGDSYVRIFVESWKMFGEQTIKDAYEIYERKTNKG